MTRAARLPLEDLLAELAAGLIALGGAVRASGVVPVSGECDLPVATRVEAGARGPIVTAELPRTQTRTAFDLPLGRLSVRLVAEPTP